MADAYGAGGGAVVPLGMRTEILANSRQAAFESGNGIEAYLARARNASTADMLGFICKHHYAPRNDIFTRLRNIDNPSLIRVVDHGAVNWNDGNRYFAFSFEQPHQGRLWQSIDETHQPLSADFLNQYFLAPIISALDHLHRMDIMHGNIRPTNIFWRDKGGGVPQLGECITAPPGVSQPVLFEPLNRAQVEPIARGVGQLADDMFALGVTLVFLLLGQNPLRGMSDEEIITLRVEKGSFAALIGKQPIPPNYFELLRGMLQDNAEQRWTPEEVQSWLSGQRLTPKPSQESGRASRAMVFEGVEYWYVRPLVRALAMNVMKSAELIERGEIDRWLRRAVHDEPCAERVESAITTFRNSGRTHRAQDQLVTIVCMAMLPTAPIYYRGKAYMAGGIGQALAERVRTGQDIQPLAEIIINQFIATWINLQPEGRSDLVMIGRTYDKARDQMDKTFVGGGIERAIYDLNPELPCHSPMIINQCVVKKEDLLPALEKAAHHARSGEPIDRHIAAWMASRDITCQKLLSPLGNPDSLIKRSLGMLHMFAHWQRKFGPAHLPGLGGWLMNSLQPLTQRYHHRPRREEMMKALQQISASGDLDQLCLLLDNTSVVEKDRQSFVAARKLYVAMTRQIEILQRQMSHQKEVSVRYGRPVANYVSWVLSAMVVVFSFISIWMTD